MATTRVFYKGKKELTMAQFEALASLDDAIDYDIIDFPNGGITNAQMTAALGYSRLFEDGEIYVCSDNGTYTKGHTYQVKVTGGVKSWEDITPASGDLQDYQIVTKEPEDKSQGKMIYENVSSPVIPQYDSVKTTVYGSPQNLIDKYINDSENWTWDDVRNLDWLGMTADASTNFWNYVMPLNESIYDTLYSNINNPLKLKVRINGAEQEITANFSTVSEEAGAIWIVSDEAGTYGFQIQTQPSPILYGGMSGVEGAPHIPDIVYAGTQASVEILSISSQDGTEIWKNIGKSSVFDITNLKIADGTKYNSIKDLVNGGMQEKLTAGTGITIENNVISTTAQDYVPKQSEVEPVALTWIINEKPSVPDKMFSVKFTSDAIIYQTIILSSTGDALPGLPDVLITYRQEDGIFDPVYDIYQGTERWVSQACRTLTFETAPSGELLTWLQANAVPQSEVDPNTALTWMFNETLINDNNGIEYDGNFVFETPDGNNWTYFSFVPSGGSLIVGSSEKSLTVYDTNGWISGVNRIITFETSAPTRNSWFTSNAVPQGSSTKTYAQVTNENGAVSIRVFENSDADLQNLSITKDGVTINGKKPLTSIQPLYKHELVIPYSFSVGDSETVNGSVVYHYLSNNGTQIASASTIDDNFLLSGGIGKNSANTILLFDVNVIKTGSSITVEAVNASTMGYITGTFGTITDTVTQLI